MKVVLVQVKGFFPFRVALQIKVFSRMIFRTLAKTYRQTCRKKERKTDSQIASAAGILNAAVSACFSLGYSIRPLVCIFFTSCFLCQSDLLPASCTCVSESYINIVDKNNPGTISQFFFLPPDALNNLKCHHPRLLIMIYC